jgi:hypothetical protein
LTVLHTLSNRRYGSSLYVASVTEAGDELRCSARGCRARAITDLHWRNPKLHDAARVKHWLACADHEAYLADFLDRRSFLLTRTSVPTG